jgi:hypothetical protein
MEEAEPLFYFFIPSLIARLKHAEREKGSPLTEAEVLAIRDAATCIVLSLPMALAAEEKRGYPDLQPSLVWEQWQEFRAREAAGHCWPEEDEA